MKITFLGTGTSQGIPVIGSKHEVCLSDDPRDKRLRSSILIQDRDTNVVIDCGPDFRQQMLNVNIDHLNAILFTHIHADHTAGIDDIRSFTLRQGSMKVYAKQDVLQNLQERFAYIFAKENRYEGAPSIDMYEVLNQKFTVEQIDFLPIEVMHGKLKILGFRTQNFAYLTDVKTIEEEQLEKLKNLDVLVINALRIDWHPTHLNLEEALKLVEKIKPKRCFFTHISHKLGFHEEVSKILPQNVFLAYDGLSLDLD
ncbi:MBL fold metallo-hydrolase [Namhaeicola litoreus]|uniref:MBL fold metallo-hydrolase n=1 Tax=Namhaeicola litoreus TaxID=1052145 RepID=A0ABW3Y486_9FLAO